MKFGQALSTRRDLLPADIADELAKLQDRVPPFPGAEARAIAERAYGRPLSEVFAHFDEQPLAAASIAQVHAARLRSGEDVVVKVLRPGVREQIERDLEVMYVLARLARDYCARRPSAAAGRGRARVREDHPRRARPDARGGQRRAAASATSRARSCCTCPEVYWDYCRPDVMVMERIHGVLVSDIDELRRARHQHPAAGRERRGDLLHAGVPPQLLPRRHAPGQHLRADRTTREHPALRGRRLRHRRHARRARPALPRREFPRVLRPRLPPRRAAARRLGLGAAGHARRRARGRGAHGVRADLQQAARRRSPSRRCCCACSRRRGASR